MILVFIWCGGSRKKHSQKSIKNEKLTERKPRRKSHE